MGDLQAKAVADRSEIGNLILLILGVFPQVRCPYISRKWREKMKNGNNTFSFQYCL